MRNGACFGTALLWRSSRKQQSPQRPVQLVAFSELVTAEWSERSSTSFSYFVEAYRDTNPETVTGRLAAPRGCAKCPLMSRHWLQLESRRTADCLLEFRPRE